MGTVCEIVAEGRDRESVQKAVTEAFEIIAELERVMTTFNHESELMRLNESAGTGRWVACSPDLFAALKESDRVRRETDGAFDVTVGSMTIHGRSPKLPRAVGGRWMRLDTARRQIRLEQAGLALDLGGIGKGYALDRAAERLIACGVTACRLNFGGQLLARGAKGWPVVLPGASGVTLTLRGVSVATSSNDEREHVVDPRTAKPAAHRGSVSVAASSATLADAYSTALLVMGREQGTRWAARHPEVRVWFVTRDPVKKGS